jgi:hypothetical protein
MAFWSEFFRPKKHVGVDLQQRGDSRYFQQYVGARGLQGRVKTYWGTNQTDAPKLRSIVGHEFDGPLDLVIDDASHIYGPTKSSFECLFPLLQPGGLYIIEDWAWEHWEGFTGPDSPFAKEEGLTRLVVEMVEATGTSTALIKSLTTYQGFTVVERGDAVLKGDGSFGLEQHIFRRPGPSGT